MYSLESYISILESVLEQQPRPLVPVTGMVTLGELQYSPGKTQLYLDPEDLSVKTRNISLDEFKVKFYKRLTDFKKVSEKLKQQLEPQAYADTLYHLIARHFSRYGIAGKEGVSIFDHIRVNAATLSAGSSHAEAPFLLLKGDVSGIQNFIYRTSDSISGQPSEGKNKAKKLRGRSFYISLLTDTIADAVIHKMGLQEANILFCGGGQFSILAPNTPEMIVAVEELRVTINMFFIKMFQLRLTLVLEFVEAPANICENFSETYSLLERKLVRAKKQKALAVLESFSQAFDRHACIEPDETFREIGEILTEGCLLIEIFDDDYKVESDGYVIDFRELGIRWILRNHSDNLAKIAKSLPDNRTRIYFLGASDLTGVLRLMDVTWQSRMINIAFGCKFFGNYVPKEPNKNGHLEVCDFDALSKKGRGHQQLDYPLLSIMRLDVDNLGAIFRFGLDDERGKTSLYHFATLSRELIFFFCHHVNRIAENNTCYVTYSGGDDAFIIGSWVNVLAFALELHKDFRSFCSHNKFLTLSAGIIQCDSHYPIQQAGFDAGMLEAEAKNFRFNGETSQGSKDAVNLFGMVVKWNTMNYLLDFAERVHILFDPDSPDRKYSRGLLHKILSQLLGTINENGSVDLAKLQVAISRITWIFARKPHGITKKRMDEYYAGKLSAIENLKVDFARGLTDRQISDITSRYSIISSYLLLKTRTRKE